MKIQLDLAGVAEVQKLHDEYHGKTSQPLPLDAAKGIVIIAKDDRLLYRALASYFADEAKDAKELLSGYVAERIRNGSGYMEEMAEAGAPQEHHRRAVQQVGPSIIISGSDEQKRDFLPRIASGEISFAMGLSEPGAGSDLASIQTSATRDGDEFVINGHKLFTSGAPYSDYLWTITRTDPDAPKHRGISMIIVPLDAPGVSVRPLLDMLGRHHINEVFMEDVRVPAANLVGEENRGWYVSATTMDFERSARAVVPSRRYGRRPPPSSASGTRRGARASPTS